MSKLILLDLSSMILENYLLRIIREHIDLDFIYDHAKDRYSSIGRPSIDPALLIKWFCDLDLDQRVPDHSTFSQNRRRRFQDD